MFEEEIKETREKVHRLKQQQKEAKLAEEKAAKRQLLVDSFEKDKLSKTDFVVKYKDSQHAINRTYYYGIPVFEGENLKGFNMMTFDEIQDENTEKIKTTPDSPYTDDQGKQKFMTIDEFLLFENDIKRRGHRPARISVREHEEEQKEVEKIVLNNSKLAKVRNKVAKWADDVTEKLGLENAVKNIFKPSIILL